MRMAYRSSINRQTVPMLAVLLAVSAAAQQTAQIELSDGFSSYAENAGGSPKWARCGGRWVMRRGQCEQTEPVYRSAYLFLTGTMLSDLDFSVRFKARPVGAGVRTPGMAFRAVDSLNCYYAHFYTRGAQLILVRRTKDKPWHELARITGVSIAEDEWHTGRVVCKGDVIQVYLNDKLVVERRDGTFSYGCIGLRCGQGHVVFDDLVLKGTVAEHSRRFVMHKDPDDESDVPRTEGVEDCSVVEGAGFFPVLVKLKDGSLGAAVRGGDAHVGIKGRLDWIHSEDGGKTWSESAVIVDSEWDDRNAGVGVMADGTVVMAYAEASTYSEDGKWDRSQGKYALYYVYSTDDGRTWTDKIPLCPDIFHSGSPYGRIITLRDGTALMQIYASDKGLLTLVDTPSRCNAVVVRSTDNGRTWGDPSLVAKGYNEISIEEVVEDGHLVAAMRSERGDIAVCGSSDAGRTWSAPKTVTKPSLHPADLGLLKSGALLMVYGCRLEPKGVQAILSDDGGKTWSFDRRVFLGWKALNSDCGYPSAVQLDDGTIVMLYYAVGTTDLEGRQCRCVRFTEEQLREAMARAGQ